jgi:hypothetical protein
MPELTLPCLCYFAHQRLALQVDEHEIPDASLPAELSKIKLADHFFYCLMTLPIFPLCPILRSAGNVHKSQLLGAHDRGLFCDAPRVQGLRQEQRREKTCGVTRMDIP